MLFPTIATAQLCLRATWRWPNFSVAELACRCDGRFCRGRYWHDPVFLDRLQALRDHLGDPLIVRSGHRCALWNAQIGGAPRSHHKRIAADIASDGHDRARLFAAAQAQRFGGIGLAQSFIHLDARQTPATWFYHGSKDLWTTSLD